MNEHTEPATDPAEETPVSDNPSLTSEDQEVAATGTSTGTVRNALADSAGVQFCTPNPEPEAPAAPAPPDAERSTADTVSTTPEDAETFPREYVERLRQENGRYRQRAQQADALAQRLHTELVRATGRLADPSDLPFDATHLDDPEALTAAVAELLGRKPHLAARRPAGDIGQGPAKASGTVDLAAILRAKAG